VVKDDTPDPSRSMPSLTTCDRTTFDRWQTGRLTDGTGRSNA
jgi:hypothetical protein